jgi:predicted nucleic-acid-binding protein
VTGLDTNVLVRYIMQDHVAQSAAAGRLIESLTADDRGFVPLVALVELSWVLSSNYDLSRDQIAQAFETLLRTREIAVENAEVVWRALRLFASSKADFADCLIERSAAAAGCERTMTFDRRATRECGMALIAA